MRELFALTVNPRLRLFTALITNFIYKQFHLITILFTRKTIANLMINFWFLWFQMAQRQRLNSMSDHSSPSSEVSENSESFDVSDLPHDSMNLETGLSSEVTENERQQIESFLAGLGTEVSFVNMAKLLSLISRKWTNKLSNT